MIAVCKEIREAISRVGGREAEQTVLRCAHTGNPCGTDTWQYGGECQCAECQRYLALKRARAQLATKEG